ncbi:MAG TPA: LamG-like jellyroll fold domain-containing protein [Pseudomonadales bacterium]|nr:LamG-like jellyroll fold domain-containing protein [Pseudomonadales bacterium]
MRTDPIDSSDIRHSFLSSNEWFKTVLGKLLAALIFCGLLMSTLALAQPVNLLFFPLTNAPGTATTSFPSSTTLGGISVNLSAYNAAGASTDFQGAAGSGVNGLVTGMATLCMTNGAGGSQPANAPNPPTTANAANSAADLGDPALAFGSVSNFIVTFWFNQPVKAPSGSGFVLPRPFVLSAGGSPGANDGSANSIGVKFQQANQFIFAIGSTAGGTLTTTYASDLTTNKWYFVAWVYDGTNIYQYTGSDTAAAALQNQFAAPGLVETFGNPTTLVVGNRNYKGARGFDGWMEDFRFYKGIATNKLSFVEGIRQTIAPKIPSISGPYPDGTSLLQATNKFVFTAIAPSGFGLTNIDLKLNNIDVSSSCTYVTNGTGSTNVTVYYNSLPQQTIETAVMTASDALGLVGSATVTFDTFSPTNFIVKAEEFDFTNGMFLDNPDYTNVPGDPNSYFGNGYTEGVDAHKGQSTGDNQLNAYRFDDGTGLNVQTPLSTGELPSPTRFGNGVVPSHMVGNWSSAEWQNYTKTFPPGSYNVYARLSTSSGSTVSFDQVTAGQGTLNQTLSRVGQFTFTGNGGFQWVPLRQGGALAQVTINGGAGGVATFRATTGGGANANFFMFVPVNPNVPAITGIYPDGAFLFEATNKLVFTAVSSANINTANIQMTLNGTNVSSGLVFSGGPTTWNVSYPTLQLNQSYNVAIQVTDNNGNSANAQLSIDTWNPVFQFEAEAFDFDPAFSPIPNGTGHRFIDNSVPTPPRTPAANSYEGQVGDILIDESGNNTPLNGQSPIQAGFAGATMSNYRTNDPCATAPVTDAARRQFGSGTLDYNVGFLGAGHWEQYTRTWPSGTYNLYARVASGANLGNLYSSFSQVVGGWGTSNQITQHLGTYAIPSSGGYSSYFYAPLIDRFGNVAQLSLNGTNTLRDTHLVFNQTETPNGAAYGLNVNFYMLLNARTDQARVDSVYPDGSLLEQGTNALSFVASSPTYGINTTNVQVTLNGVNVSSGLVFSGNSGSWNVSYPGLQPNSSYTAVITVTDNNNQVHTTTVSFDTFNSTNFTWEAEDFDFDPANSPDPNNSNLRYIDSPVPTSAPATNSYYGQTGDLDIDYSSQFINLNVLPVPAVYRTSAQNLNNIVPIQVTADAQRARTANAQVQQANPYIQDYEIFNLTNTAWINYTHTFPAGNYYVYARLSAGGTSNITFQCAQVTSGAGTSTQTTNVIGYFQAMGNSYGSYQYAPLMNTNTGTHIQLPISGIQTLQVTGDGFERVNFFMLVPAGTVKLGSSVVGTNVVLSFPTQTGFKYAVSYKNDLNDPAWTPLGTTVNGTGLTQSVSDGLGQNHRFYLLSVQ